MLSDMSKVVVVPAHCPARRGVRFCHGNVGWRMRTRVAGNSRPATNDPLGSLATTCDVSFSVWNIRDSSTFGLLSSISVDGEHVSVTAVHLVYYHWMSVAELACYLSMALLQPAILDMATHAAHASKNARPPAPAHSTPDPTLACLLCCFALPAIAPPRIVLTPSQRSPSRAVQCGRADAVWHQSAPVQCCRDAI